jgi:hypothetical protein
MAITFKLNEYLTWLDLHQMKKWQGFAGCWNAGRQAKPAALTLETISSPGNISKER